MDFFLKAIASPVTYVLIAVILIFSLWNINTGLRSELKANKEAVAEMKVDIKKINENTQIIIGDGERVTGLLKKKQTLTAKQDTISDKINSIPDTSTCQPFQNPNTLDAARQFRDYQVEALKK